MTAQTLQSLLKKKESTHLEFKRTIDNPYRIARTLAAFANTSGGFLLVGIEDNKQVVGINSELAEIEKLSKATHELIDPPLPLRYSCVALEGKKVLLVKIEASPQKPHQTLQSDGSLSTYIRANDKTVPAGKKMYNLLKNSNLNNVSEDSLARENHVKILLQFLEKANQISAKQYAKMANISEYRAEKTLQSLTQKGVLLYLEKMKPKVYCLRNA